MITGKWACASGCLHADWAVLGVTTLDEAGEEVDQGLALIPKDELDIQDT